MKTYTHSNGMKAEILSYENKDELYSVRINWWIILTKKQLLDFWFIEDKQEELEKKCIHWNNICCPSCYMMIKTRDDKQEDISKCESIQEVNRNLENFAESIKDNKEDWIEQLIKEINIWNTNTDISKELYNRHSDFLRKAILKYYPLN